MIVRHLGDTDFKTIMECFLSAFENYFVKMPTDHNFYKQRWKAAGVKFDLSYGMFDDDILVGFIINAVDERQGELIAYNSGTGVIPDYRGQRIVKTIYDYAIPDLIKHGITKCQLEVITENVKAIKSYEGIGFKKCKHYQCFKGAISQESLTNFKVREVTFDIMNWNALPNQEFYSWDNQTKSIAKGEFNYYQVLENDNIEAYFVINLDTGYIVQFEVLENSTSNWNTLFSVIQSIKKDIRINNIDDRLISKIKAVESAGLKNTVNQYEMELMLK
ncbi:GNAT family N-acetyltransferase [Winogradskyella sp.]|uniref:GNAT family N-acetyltransferase n=1 Tax=Winogradskyella sp. TaxID=1883156 RepID=UPI0025FB924E|nr:GNAT family N-acetyltransferase [Winogradskyella sp.]